MSSENSGVFCGCWSRKQLGTWHFSPLHFQVAGGSHFLHLQSSAAIYAEPIIYGPTFNHAFIYKWELLKCPRSYVIQGLPVRYNVRLGSHAFLIYILHLILLTHTYAGLMQACLRGCSSSFMLGYCLSSSWVIVTTLEIMLFKENNNAPKWFLLNICWIKCLKTY